MTRHDLRLVPAAAAVWIIAALQSARAPWLLVVAVLAADASLSALLCLGWARVRRAAGGALLVAWVAACGAAFVGHARLAGEAPLLDAVGARVELTGTVVDEPRSVGSDMFTGEPRVAVEIDVEQIGQVGGGAVASGEALAAQGRVVVIAPGAWTALSLGQRVVTHASLEGAGAGRATALVWDPELVSASDPTGLWGSVGELRATFRALTADLPESRRGLVRGMVIGDTRAMSTEQVEAMRTAGLTHLTAVSGAHFSVVALAVSAVLRLLRWPRALRATVLAGAMTAFAAVVLPGPSVVRALTMALVVAVALAWGRPAQALPALAAGALALLTWDPHLALEIGFVLSVLAVGAIVLLAPLLARSLQRVLLPAVAKALAVPLAAQLTCAPVLVVLSPQAGPYTVPANLIAAVAAMPVTILGLAALVLASLGLPGGGVLTTLSSLSAAPVAAAASGFSALPGARLAWPSGVLGVLAMSAVCGALAVGFVGIGAARPGAHAWIWAASGGFLAAAVFAVPSVRAAAGSPAPEDWAIVSCDVGQGDMTLVRAGPHAAVVVDTGPPGGAGAACLRRFDVRDVPLLVLTHPHADHDGAVVEIARVARIGAAWTSAAGVESAQFDLSALDVRGEVPAAGMRVSVGEATVTVLPTDGVAGGDAGASGESEVNDASLALLVTARSVSALLLGDLEEPGQRRLAGSLDPLVVDAVKVAHHGSASQDEGLAALISARVALVSVGAGNAYGHPADTALSLYGAVATEVLRTDECGNVALTWNGGLGIASGCPRPVAG